MIARQGKRGVAGERGERGSKGDPGAPGPGAPSIKAWRVDRKRFVATPVLTNDQEGPPIELRSLFEEFQKQTA
jgi:hypothetical protein